jgi:hypothetical protein
MNTSWQRQWENGTPCGRNGDVGTCGIFYIVTDHIGKPAVVLNSSMQVAAAMDYEPFGGANSVSLDREISGPGTFATFSQPVGGASNPNTTVDLRVRLPVVGVGGDS